MEKISLKKERQLRFAQELYQAGRFVRAAAEYERFISFFPEDARVPETRYRIAEAYFKAGQYQEAAGVCKKVIEKKPDGMESARFHIILVRCHMMQNDFNQALLDLHNLLSVYQQPAIRDKARYLGAWIFIETGQWTKARTWLQAISPRGRAQYHVEPLMTDLSADDHIPRKSPQVAGLLAILPGAGHLYTGRYQDALISFSLNTLSIWAAYEAFDNDLPALGSLLGLVSFNLYTGNIYSAVNGSHKFNRRAKQEYIDRLRLRAPARLSLGVIDKGGFFNVSVDF